MGDLRQRVVRGAEEIAALLDTPGNEIVDGRDAVFPAEGMDHIILIDVGQLREQLQIDALLKVAVDIPAHGGALILVLRPVGATLSVKLVLRIRRTSSTSSRS